MIAGPRVPGKPVKSLSPVLAVKIDNVARARPQTGLTDADIVYVLPVEGGLSRVLAVFSSRVPPTVGPVRSAREGDLELLRQFGRPAFAYSGAQPHLLPFIECARIVDLYSGLAGGYFRDPGRVAPHNLYARTRQLLSEARAASVARDIGFRFGAAPPGGRRRPVTVIVQYTKVRTSRFLEAGSRPPYAETTASGTGVVLRDGQAYPIRWSRPSADEGTTFTTAAGEPAAFARGQVWVMLTTAA